ncbi:MAG: sigma-70 family RNA polymerase sigma factor [Anaerolineales bacterium]|nr:sigma-70 family RNA polymerase sigma factor [Anaerolineales bacterium]
MEERLMAYPAKQPDNSENLSYLLDKEETDDFDPKDEISALFSNGNGAFKRLRMHFFEVTEAEDELSDAAEIDEEDLPTEDTKSQYAPSRYRGYDRGDRIDAVGLYLKEMSRVPLLTNEQEIEIAKRIERAKRAKSALAKLNGRTPVKKKANLRAVIEDGRRAREHLIKANTRLVVSIAKKYIGRGVPFLDLIQEGNLGLMKAVNKYDYRRGFRFSTYATWWIRQTITRSIADQGRTIRVPVHMIDRIRQLYKAAQKLEQVLGRPPNVEELAAELELEIRKVQWMLKVSWLPLSLESPVGDDEDSELGMFVEDEKTPSPSQAAYFNMLSDKVNEVLSTLSPREARILRLRFGLENGRTYTLEEVGEKFGLTRERIRQIEGKALRRLRHPMRARQLREYL